MKKWKRTAALAVVAAMMLSGPLNVSAAGVRDVFDAEYYADSYEDLKEAFGDNADALLQHYMTCGLSEGRSGSKVFDVAEYRSAYGDLEAAFGDDWDAYVNHYCTSGIKEGRTAGVYGEIELNQDDNQHSDADSANKDSSNDIWLQRGESADAVIDLEGAAEPLHAAVTYIDYYEDGITGPGVIGKADRVIYHFTVLIEYEPYDVESYGYHGFSYGFECGDAYDIRQGDTEWYFIINDRGVAYDCCVSVGWSAFDYESFSQTVEFYAYLPWAYFPADQYTSLYPKVSVDGGETWMLLDWKVDPNS